MLLPLLFAASPATAARILDRDERAVPARVAAADSGLDAAIAHRPSHGGDGTATWTRRDLLEAEPLDSRANGTSGSSFRSEPSGGAAISDALISDVLIPDPTLPPWRPHGKVFFKLADDSADIYSCSATVARSKRRNVIFTAGHCAWDPETGAWVQEMVFVPGYREGATPLGLYSAVKMVAPRGWVKKSLTTYDLAAVALDRRVQVRTGAPKLNFGGDPIGRGYSIFGYPGGPPSAEDPAPLYDGEQLIRCDATGYALDDKRAAPYPVAAKPCLMKQGASGGGWISNGHLTSIISYSHCNENPDLCDTIFGPQFTEAAVSVYTHRRIGGSATPAIRLRSAPRRLVRQRRVAFRFQGGGDTPVRNFLLKLDRQKPVLRSGRIVITRLSRGRHILRARSMDQTGHLSKRVIRRVFRVLPRRQRR